MRFSGEFTARRSLTATAHSGAGRGVTTRMVTLRALRLPGLIPKADILPINNHCVY